MRSIMWIVQALLAALFLFSGAMKFIMPLEAMTREIVLPGLFLHFIGVAEICGGLGLVLPGILRIRPILMPLAAAGLALIMAGATVVTLRTAPPVQAIFPLVCGILCTWIAWARWEPALLRDRR